MLLKISIFLIGIQAVVSGKVLLILVDGCRWNYPDEDSNLRGFKKIADYGVRASYVTPIFPANSYPNWYTIVTGLYAENHGFVQNVMYDSQNQDFFMMAPDPSVDVPHWWNDAEPIWITAEKRQLSTALYWWDGCQVNIRGKRPRFCERYHPLSQGWNSVNRDVRDVLLNSLNLLKNGTYQLVQVYYEPVDFNGHLYGPDSSQRKDAFRDIDNILNDLQDEMVKMKVENDINLVVVSDHGMTSTSNENIHKINIESVIDVDDIKYMIYKGASSMILPVEGKEQKVYDALKEANIKGLNVYLKKFIPEEYHLKNHRLVLPILLVADSGFYINGLGIKGKSIDSEPSISLGSHGYDPYKTPDMRTIFFARGPGIKKGFTSDPLQNIDHYNFVCHLLGIKPLPNNGSWERVSPMLVNSANIYKTGIPMYLILFLSSLFTFVLQ